MKETEEKNKGITLIALTITIIVLLILAGVTIQTLTGDNGLIQKATTAKEENEKAKELELIKLAVSAAQVAGEGTITKDKLENELKSNFGDNKEVFENNTFFYCNGYRIYKDGKVEEGKLLPDEYQEVEYIESSGMQYINTKYYPDKDTNAKYKVSVLEYKIYGPHLLSSKNYFFHFLGIIKMIYVHSGQVVQELIYIT